MHHQASVNLEAEYDEVVAFIKDYQRFVQKVNARLFSYLVRDPKRYFSLTRHFSSFFAQINPLSGKNPDLAKSLISDVANAEEKENEHYAILVSHYPTDALSDVLMRKYPGADFDALLKIHGLRRIALSRFNLAQIPGYILAAATLMLNSVPKTVAESVFNTTYEQFEVTVFWVMMVLLGYALLIMLPAWLVYRKAKDTHQSVGDVLEYTAIKGSSGSEGA